jgi:hypothetical protein
LEINIVHAFQTAPYLSAFLNGLSGTNILAAYSLGNMVVLGAMNYTNTSIDTFFVIDAAVAIEALDGSATQSANMIHPDWNSYTNRLWASEWFKLFPTNDYRSTLTWRDRLANFGNAQVYNFYSSGEEVLREHVGPPPTITGAIFDQALVYTLFGTEPQGAFTWAWQEKLKGRCAGNWIIGSNHGGWAFNSIYNDAFGNHMSNSIASLLPGSELQTNSFFNFNNNNYTIHPDSALLDVNGSSYAQANRNRILSDAIPALTLPVGANPVARLAPQFGPNRNFDMQSRFENGWPTGRPQRNFGAVAPGEWHHSDVRQVAYTFTYKLFDEIVNDGNLRACFENGFMPHWPNV